MRLFVALTLPDKLRETLAALIRELRQIDRSPRWIPPENLHITLKFIGEVAPDKLQAIGESLAGVKMPLPIKLEFRGGGFFPNARRPSVAWVGIDAPASLASLAGEVNQSLACLGIPPEEKSFVPHLTIARFKETRLSAGLLVEFDRRKSDRFGEFTTAGFQLIESQLKSTGAEYTTLRSFTFVSEGKDS
jgi:2'-5' RNA ligase